MPDHGRIEVGASGVFVYPPGQTDPEPVGMAFAVRALLSHGPLVEACRAALDGFRAALGGGHYERCGPVWKKAMEKLHAAIALAEKGGA